MKIEFTVNEYFKELKLMQEQYGQEEDLYPWIYMLLQMVKSEKNHVNLSIRDTHNWKKKHAPKNMEQCKRQNILNEISSCNGGAPEFLLMDIKSEYYLGCVEIKKLNDPDWTPLKQGEFQDLTTEIFKIKCAVYENENIDKGFYETEIRKLFGEDLKPKSVKYFRSFQQKTHYFEVIIEKVDCESLYENLDNILWPEEIKIVERKQLPCYEEEQIKHHLRRFKKVLYTNGLEFYLLTQQDASENICVRRVADLSKAFELFKNEQDFQIEAENEWSNLKKGIEWEKEPIRKI